MMPQFHSMRDLPDAFRTRNRREVSDHLLFGHVIRIRFFVRLYWALCI